MNLAGQIQILDDLRNSSLLFPNIYRHCRLSKSNQSKKKTTLWIQLPYQCSRMNSPLLLNNITVMKEERFATRETVSILYKLAYDRAEIFPQELILLQWWLCCAPLSCEFQHFVILLSAFVVLIFQNVFFIILSFLTIGFIFIVIFTMFWLICPLAFFSCFLSNSGAYTELQTMSFI